MTELIVMEDVDNEANLYILRDIGHVGGQCHGQLFENNNSPKLTKS